MKPNILYRIHEKWSHQSWYDPNAVFILIKITENRMGQFGVDCIWENVQTGFHINHWDNTMRELTKDEVREFQLNKILS